MRNSFHNVSKGRYVSIWLIAECLEQGRNCVTQGKGRAIRQEQAKPTRSSSKFSSHIDSIGNRVATCSVVSRSVVNTDTKV